MTRTQVPALMILSQVLLAQAPPTSQGRVARLLHLSEGQRTAMAEVRQKHQPELQRLGQAVRSARTELARAMGNPDLSATQLRPLFERAAEAQFAWRMAARDQRLELRRLLTPEQQTKAEVLREAALERRGDRLGRRIQPPRD